MNLEHPISFCKEYVFIKKTSNQIVQFMATVLGIKKSYDDWFDVNNIPAVKEMCKKYGLHYKFDWIFIPFQNVDNVISGGKRLPTTKALGQPFNQNINHGNVHIFFSKSKKDLELSFRNGWYPLIVDNRAVHKPFIDIIRFGHFLGYPKCCIDFFRMYNNHFKFNNLFETLRNTKGKPNKFCNSILKDHTFSYIYHIPCSYSCKKTIAYGKRLRRELIKVEPEFVKKMDEMLTKPLLVFNEQNAYIFEGKIKGNQLNYSSFAFLGPPEKNLFSDIFSNGNKIEVYNSHIEVYNFENLIYDIQKQGVDGFILNFGD